MTGRNRRGRKHRIFKLYLEYTLSRLPHHFLQRRRKGDSLFVILVEILRYSFPLPVSPKTFNPQNAVQTGVLQQNFDSTDRPELETNPAVDLADP